MTTEKVNAEALADDVTTQALGQSWFFDPQTIAVTVAGGQVRLSGSAD